METRASRRVAFLILLTAIVAACSKTEPAPGGQPVGKIRILSLKCKATYVPRADTTIQRRTALECTVVADNGEGTAQVSEMASDTVYSPWPQN